MGRHTPDQGHSVFLTLDGLRGYGAILVFLGHTMLFWGYFVMPTSPVCVDLFFLLSGFVIAYAYEPRIAAGMTAAEFMTHRVVRLYPLYLLGMLIGFVLALVGVFNEPDPLGYLGGVLTDVSLQLFMLPSPDSAKGTALYAFNMPAWTLLFELAANLVYVLLWRRLSTPVLIALVAAFGIWLTFAAVNYGSIDMGWRWEGVAGGLARGCFGFFMGVLVFRLVGSPRQPGKTRSAWPLYIFAVVTVISILPAPPAVRPFLDVLLVVGIGAPLLVAGQMAEPPRMLAPMMALLGRISFALYILHFPLYEMFTRVTWAVQPLWPFKAYLGPFLLVGVLAAAYAAERWYDRPARRWIVAKLRQRAQQRSVLASRISQASRWGATGADAPAPGAAR